MPANYRKAFIPLESNPEVFNELSAILGVSPEVQFEDIFALDEPDFLPHPALALILVFPEANNYGSRTRESEIARPAYAGSGDGEPVVWFRQTIHNACGLYAALHALSNGETRNFIEPDSILSRLLKTCIPLTPTARAEGLEESAELEQAHAAVAVKGDSAVPESAEVEVTEHYICLVKSEKDGHVYELDGDWKGPIDTGIVLGPDEDVLGPQTLKIVQDLVDSAGSNVNFNILALVKRLSEA